MRSLQSVPLLFQILHSIAPNQMLGIPFATLQEYGEYGRVCVRAPWKWLAN